MISCENCANRPGRDGNDDLCNECFNNAVMYNKVYAGFERFDEEIIVKQGGKSIMYINVDDVTIIDDVMYQLLKEDTPYSRSDIITDFCPGDFGYNNSNCCEKEECNRCWHRKFKGEKTDINSITRLIHSVMVGARGEKQ